MISWDLLKPYRLAFFCSLAALWGPYLGWLAWDCSIEGYVWANLLAAPLLGPSLVFPGWEHLDDNGLLIKIAEVLIGEAIRYDDLPWQHVLYCLGTPVVLLAMTIIGHRGPWHLLGVVACSLAIQGHTIWCFEIDF